MFINRQLFLVMILLLTGSHSAFANPLDWIGAAVNGIATIIDAATDEGGDDGK